MSTEHTMTDSEKLQWYFQQDDIRFFPDIKRWIIDDLKKRVEDVSGILIEQPAYEVLSDTTWRKFAPGHYIHFILTFADGEQRVKSFEYDTDQQKWRPI